MVRTEKFNPLRKTDPVKFCGICEKTLTRKRYKNKNRLECRTYFLKRKFCSKECEGIQKAIQHAAKSTVAFYLKELSI